MDSIVIKREQIEPLNNMLLLDVPSKATETEAGIKIANTQENEEQAPMVAKVLKMGPKVTDIKVGDLIMYRRYAADKVLYRDAENSEKVFWLLEMESVLAIIKQDGA